MKKQHAVRNSDMTLGRWSVVVGTYLLLVFAAWVGAQ